MKNRTENMRKISLALSLTCIGLAAYWVMPFFKNRPPDPQSATSALVDITLPAQFSETARIGKTAYDAKCASCHGENAVGQDGVAPPLVHKIYEPSHHGDESFQRAAKLGVRAHHWRFGDMPPVDGITRAEVKMIVAYIRTLQAANGIH